MVSDGLAKTWGCLNKRHQTAVPLPAQGCSCSCPCEERARQTEGGTKDSKTGEIKVRTIVRCVVVELPLVIIFAAKILAMLTPGWHSSLGRSYSAVLSMPAENTCISHPNHCVYNQRGEEEAL